MMNSMRKQIKVLHVISVILVILLIAVLFYALNYYTPLYADDYSYSFSFSSGERIKSVLQILDSQIGHYQNTNGRSVTHSLAQLFLLAGDSIFNYVNVVFFIILVCLACFHGCGSFRRISITKIALIAMLLFLSCPAFGQSFLWITGAANYLYGILIILIVLSPYRVQMNAQTNRKYPIIIEIVSALAYFVLGTIAGWTNENTSVAMIVMMIAYVVIFVLKGIRVHAWNITGCIGGICGCVTMLSSPGTASRLNSAGGSGSIITWLKRIVFYSSDLIINLYIVLIIFSVLVILYFFQKRQLIDHGNWRKTIRSFGECDVTLIYLLGSLATVYSMIVSPEFPGRAWSGPVILWLVTVMNFSALVDMSGVNVRIGKTFAVVFVVILFFSTYINAFYELKNINAAYNDRVSTIEAAVASGIESVDIPSIAGMSGYSCYHIHGDLSSDSNEWPNVSIAAYYGIDEINCSD